MLNATFAGIGDHMKSIRADYTSLVDRTLDIVCKAQSWVSVISAVLIWALSERVSPELGRLGVVIALLSIPSLAWWAKRRIKVFENQDWRKHHPNLDYSGTWDVHTEFIYAIEIASTDNLPPDQEGQLIISQTAFDLKLASSSLKSVKNGENLYGWHWLAVSVDDSGRYVYTAYQMEDIPNPLFKDKRSHGVGFEKIEVTEWEEMNPQKRPVRMESFWYDCVRSDRSEPMYIGRTIYTKRTNRKDGASTVEIKKSNTDEGKK